MYYAACCCEDPAPPCECGEDKYASVSWAMSDRYTPYFVNQNECDRVCFRNRFTSFVDTYRRYTSGKVYMRCDTGTGVRYNTASLPPSRRTFDRDSLTVLATDQIFRLETYDAPAIYNCCDPPGLYCFDQPGTYRQVFSRNGSLYPFDPDDPAGDFGGFASINPTASTRVDRGLYIRSSVPSQFFDLIDPNKYYRKTTVTMTWRLWMKYFEYDYQPFFEPYETRDEYDELSGGGFGSQNIHTLTKVALIGDECDAFAIGDPVVNYGFAGFIGGGGPGVTESELPISSFLDFSSDETCAASTYFKPCCQDSSTFPETYGSSLSYFSSEADGGLFGLEFTDQPPPELP
tara:strand:+ start:7391 stop:8428 length:1038 start_codon:yes stop_codon:yes gene_type:complete